MLRLLALLLLLANLLYFGWTLGWLDAVVGIRASGDREPARLARQLRPELVRLIEPAASAAAAETAASTAASASVSDTVDGAASAASAAATTAAASMPASAPASAPATTAAPAPAAPASAAASAASAVAAAASATASQCLEAGPLQAGQLAALQAALKPVMPDGGWTERNVAGSGEFLIYMGPYPDAGWIERKKEELSRIRGGLPYQVVESPPELARGISLGRFASQADAQARLDQYKTRGIRTARVVRAGDGPQRSYLRVGAADAPLAARLATLKLPAGVTGFSSCTAER